MISGSLNINFILGSNTRPSPPAVDLADPPSASCIPLKLVVDFHCFAKKLFRNDAFMFAVRFATRLDYACLNPFLVPLFTLGYCTFQMNVKLMTSIVMEFHDKFSFRQTST